MDLAAYRQLRGLSQEDCARELGLRSKGYISDIETGAQSAGVRLSLKIEAWSNGLVKAATVCPALTEIVRRPKRSRAA